MFSVTNLNFAKVFIAHHNVSKLAYNESPFYQTYTEIHRNTFAKTYEGYIITNIRTIYVFIC